LADEFNPYRAPDAPVVEDFIAVEPLRRPFSNFVAAASCYGFSTFLVAIELAVGYMLIAFPRLNGPPQLFKVLLVVTLVTYATLASFFAGRLFWRRRDRPAAILLLTAIGAFASIFLLPLLIP
jgi:hypothetical protein